MLNLFKSIFTRQPTQKKIAFLDGDQGIPNLIDAYNTYLKGTETHLIKLLGENVGEPWRLRGEVGFNKIYLRGYTVGKEVVDKFIGAYIQKAVDDGFNHITVVSNDYDFIDTFKMTSKLNPDKSLTFRIIVPCGQGRVKQLATTQELEVVHMKQENENVLHI